MKIFTHNDKMVTIDTPNGSFTIHEDGSMTRISMHDHFDMEVRGEPKEFPRIILDSNEYKTELTVKETEERWVNLSVQCWPNEN